MSDVINEEELLNKNSNKFNSNESGSSKSDSISSSSSKWKYGVFFAIWLVSAWHLLTVSEKVLIVYPVSIDANHKKSMINLKQDLGNDLTIMLHDFQFSIYRSMIMDQESPLL